MEERSKTTDDDIKISLFLGFLEDASFRKKYFDIHLYQEAVQKLGELKEEECFGFNKILVSNHSIRFTSAYKTKTLMSNCKHGTIPALCRVLLSGFMIV